MIKQAYLVLLLSAVLVLAGCAGDDSDDASKKLYLAGWLYLQEGIKTFSDNVEIFSEINPVWYNILAGGRISHNANLAYKAEIMNLARANNVKVLPTIQNTYPGGAEVVRKVLSSPVLCSRHIQDLVNLVISPENDFDGIDIDYEDLSQRDTGIFSAFVCKLSTELSKYGKLLSVCVYYKSDHSSKYGQYWPELIQYVDTLKVMAYNCHYSSSRPGPICPLQWLQGTLDYAKELPNAKDKIIIGLPLYGFDWVKNSGARARAVTYKEIQRLMRRYAINTNKIGWDNGESYFTYSEGGRNHIVYFQDSIALWERLN
ncbi:MAG TPA: glycosyl hydrolase family 18 protein, partial [Bacillota bacterium]